MNNQLIYSEPPDSPHYVHCAQCGGMAVVGFLTGGNALCDYCQELNERVRHAAVLEE